MAKNRLRTNFILNTIAQVLRIITPFVTTPYISRVLGVDNVGIFSYSYSIQSYFCLFAVLGTAAYGTREIARKRDNRAQVSTAFWEIEALRAVTAMIALAGWMVVVGVSDNRIIFIILSTYLIASMLDISWLYMGLEMFPFIVARTILVRLLEVVSVFVFVKGEADLPIYCAIMGGGTLIGNVTLWISLHKCVDRVKLRNIHPWRHLKDTLVYFLPSVATTIYTVLDKTLIGVITSSDYENGIYEQATKVVEIAKAIAFVSLNSVMSPRCSYLYRTGQFDKIKANLKLSTDIMLAIGFGFVFGIAVVSDRFVPTFFGAGYDGVILLLKLLTPIIIIITISGALGDQYYNPAGLRAKTSRYLIVGAGVNLVLNLLLIPAFRSAGAVIASVIAETVITALYLINCDGYLKLRTILKLSAKKLIAGAVMVVAVLATDGLFAANVLGLFIVVAIGGSVYLAALLLLRDSAMMYAVNELTKRILRKRNAG
ncbi:MAG: polysaccharide biosynthesis protein [Lachnospiraceae bacterium]|nr:polysaccharide biosynthesis protein [Lachnospiraceae bacterium]